MTAPIEGGSTEQPEGADHVGTQSSSKIPTSLVLGSGGARGLAHIGVIQYLEDHGYDVRYIAGASIGALVGGIYAAGKLDVYTEWVSALQRFDVLRLLDWSLVGGALFKGDRIMHVLIDLIGDCRIEDLPIGFTAIATELSTSRELWLNRGSLFEAIRASIAVPMIFAPVTRGGQVLIDGGIVNPLPVAPTLNFHSDITIAVDLNGPDEPVHGSLSQQQDDDGSHEQSYRDRIGAFIDGMRAAAADPASRDLGFYDLATRSMEIMQRTITQMKSSAYSPTVQIQLPRTICGFFDFHRSKDLIAYGYERAQQTLEGERLPS